MLLLYLMAGIYCFSLRYSVACQSVCETSLNYWVAAARQQKTNIIDTNVTGNTNQTNCGLMHILIKDEVQNKIVDALYI